MLRNLPLPFLTVNVVLIKASKILEAELNTIAIVGFL